MNRDLITNYLLDHRPKRLLVYINPNSGKRQAKQIYEQRVAPLFSRASVSTHVIGESPSTPRINILMKHGAATGPWMISAAGRQGPAWKKTALFMTLAKYYNEDCDSP